MKSVEFYGHWQEHNGKTVLIDGKRHKIKVSVIQSVSPMISVYAEPLNKISKEYLEIKKTLGDDWEVDVLESDIEKMVDIERQCNAK